MAPALRITDLDYTYPRDEDGGAFRLRMARLELAPGESLLLTAESGGGKSTLLALIAGLTDPGSGRIEVAGTDIHALAGAARDRFRGRNIGMIFQTFNLLRGFTARENIEAALMFSDIPAREHTRRAEELLAKLGLTRPGAMVERMSVGQQQRVAVARAVACRPALVLADEPTASLDPANAGAAIGLIQSACADAGAALLCVSHDPAMAERFTRRERLGEAVGVGAGVGVKP